MKAAAAQAIARRIFDELTDEGFTKDDLLEAATDLIEDCSVDADEFDMIADALCALI